MVEKSTRGAIGKSVIVSSDFTVLDKMPSFSIICYVTELCH